MADNIDPKEFYDLRSNVAVMMASLAHLEEMVKASIADEREHRIALRTEREEHRQAQAIAMEKYQADQAQLLAALNDRIAPLEFRMRNITAAIGAILGALSTIGIGLLMNWLGGP